LVRPQLGRPSTLLRHVADEDTRGGIVHAGDTGLEGLQPPPRTRGRELDDLDLPELDGVTYVCDGAVSGAWWKGPKERCAEGYGLFDLFDDGSFKHQYVPYGWKIEG
jgi:hypothetical protein